MEDIKSQNFMEQSLQIQQFVHKWLLDGTGYFTG